jgi:hypothetical protein
MATKKPTHAAKAAAHKPATKPRPIPGRMQNADATSIDGWTPPAKPGKAPTRKAPPDKPKHTPKKPSAKARAAASRPKPRGAR